MKGPTEYERPEGWQPLDSTAGRSQQKSILNQDPLANGANRPIPARPPGGKRIPGSRLVVILAVSLALVLIAGAGSDMVPRTQRTLVPAPTSRVTTPTSAVRVEVGTDWRVLAETLRPELDEPLFQFSTGGGDRADRNVIDGGSTWVVLTGTRQGADIVVHGVDARTGRERWRRPLSNALCAALPLGSSVVCTWALPRAGRQQGTRWRVSVIDPDTGTDRRTRDLTGPFTLIDLVAGRIVLVEQRRPAPRAVITALAGDLRTDWSTDLSTSAGQAELFTQLEESPRGRLLGDGVDLTPAVKVVGNGRLIAVTSQTRTALFDARTGQVAGLPRCSRLVDDGDRLWCDDRNRVVAYSYGLNRLWGTAVGIHLAEHCTRGEQPTFPVFLAKDGTALSINPRTGRTTGTLAQSRTVGSQTPTSCQVGSTVVITDANGAFGIDAPRQKLIWQNRTWHREVTDPVGLIPRGDRWLVTASDLFWIDPATGAASDVRDNLGSTQAVGPALAGFVQTELVKVREP